MPLRAMAKLRTPSPRVISVEGKPDLVRCALRLFWLRLATAALFAVSPILGQVIPGQAVASPTLTPEEVAARLARWAQAQASHLSAPAASSRFSSSAPSTGQQATLARLERFAKSNFQARFREHSGAPLMIKGSTLEPRFSGFAKSDSDRSERTALNFLRANRELLRISEPDQELVLTEHKSDELNFHHFRFEQRFKGLPVWPCELMVHVNPAGEVYLMNGTHVPTPGDLTTEPAVEPAEALRIALRNTSEAAPAEAPAPTLIIYGPIDRSPRLAWKFDLAAGRADASRWVVDALNGAVLAHNTLAQREAAVGSGIDSLGQPRELRLWHANGAYFMVDTSKAMFDASSFPPFNARGAIQIYDGQHQILTDVRATAGLVASTSAVSGWPSDAVSAAYALSQAYDYYLQAHNRNSVDAFGADIRVIIHYGRNIQNGFWMPATKTVVLGESIPKSIDFCGHEFTHGVIDHTGNGGILEYRFQSGALNESLADIFGEMIQARSSGQPDWLFSVELGGGSRDMANPASRIALTGRPHPSKMSQFENLPDGQAGDNGGVHVNSSIINHAFYQLAVGLPNALGLRDAERIFYRAMTVHLQKQSQFIDMRHAAVSSAEEIFGTSSPQAERTGQAFDFVEIVDAPETPAPSPTPAVQGPDSTLALRFDPAARQYVLIRREAAFNDSETGSVMPTGGFVAPKRVSVTGNGSRCVFVTSQSDVAIMATDGSALSFGNVPGFVHSVAVSPDGNRYSFVVKDPTSGVATNEIVLVEVSSGNLRRVKLFAPGTEASRFEVVRFADSMYFRPDSTTLVYDAFAQLSVVNGAIFGSWTIFELNTLDESIRSLINLSESFDVGSPSLGRTRNNLLRYEVIDKRTLVSTLFAADLASGKFGPVGQLGSAGALGVPSYTGDDTAIVYAQADPSVPTGASLLRQGLAADGITPVGQPAFWLRDAAYPLVYRRGQFANSNALPTVQLSEPRPGAILTAPGRFILDATASDPDGQIAKVEFYEGSSKIFEIAQPPYAMLYSDAPAREYTFTARAIDNVGGARDSNPVTVRIISADRPVLKIERGSNVLSVSWPASASGYVLQSTENLGDLNSWSSNLPPPSSNGTNLSVQVDIGPRQRFYRLRKAQ
jgi:Zn-dependent metalloprotease